MASQSVSVRVANESCAAARDFLTTLWPARHGFAIRLWDGTLIEGSGSPRFTVVLRRPGALRRMFSPPIELSMAEAYIRGDFEVEGDLATAFSLFEGLALAPPHRQTVLKLARIWRALPSDDGQLDPIARGPAHLRGALHSKERDRAAIAYHYDVGNEFYALWLDRNLNYSCAYFETGDEDIDTAQEQKMEHICRKLRLSPGERLLDIGCGWGGFVQYAARVYGATVLGVTLSERQVELACRRIAEAGLQSRATVELRDYRDLGEGRFDKIVSVGMFEHVGRDHLPEYFAHAYRLLKPGGLFLNHGISVHPAPYGPSSKSAWLHFVERRLLGWGDFSRRYIFPDGELVPVSDVNGLAERAGFEVRDVENLREHYALTLRHWVARLDARRDAVIQAANESVYRTWRLYLSGSAYGFESGRINVNQSLLAKPDRGRAGLPLTRADLYERRASRA